MSTEVKSVSSSEKKPSYSRRLVEHLKSTTIDPVTIADVIKAIEEFATKEYQLIASERAMSAGLMNFGKYKGKPLAEVAKLDAKYITWLKKNDQFLSKDLKVILAAM